VCGAVEALTRALAVELAPIRVNAIAPGVVRTDLWRDLSESERAELYAGVGAGLPVGRVGEPEEIAQAFAYLMHNGYTTGTILPINGGGLLV
jgi:NAD(P)-dependent dehydrogenase (short-subunit alcohol dehydrogenase family)